MLKDLRNKLRNKKGFTLIELIIVIAIIGILAMILIPQFGNFRKGAVESSAKSLMKNLATAYTAERARLSNADWTTFLSNPNNLANSVRTGATSTTLDANISAAGISIAPITASTTESNIAFVYAASGYTVYADYNYNTNLVQVDDTAGIQ